MTALLLLLAAIQTPATPAPPPTATKSDAAPSAARLERARALTELLNPSAAMIEVNMRGWEAGVANALKIDPGAAKIEEAHPGGLKAAIDAVRPVGRKHVLAFLQTGLSHKARLIAERLSDAELTEALKLFSGPAWTRFARGLSASADPAPLARDAARSMADTGKPGFTKEALERSMMRAGRGAAAGMTADDHIAMMRIAQSPVGAKIRAITAENDRMLLEMMNSPDPAAVAEQQAAINAAVIAYVDARAK